MRQFCFCFKRSIRLDVSKLDRFSERTCIISTIRCFVFNYCSWSHRTTTWFWMRVAYTCHRITYPYTVATKRCVGCMILWVGNYMAAAAHHGVISQQSHYHILYSVCDRCCSSHFNTAIIIRYYLSLLMGLSRILYKILFSLILCNIYT